MIRFGLVVSALVASAAARAQPSAQELLHRACAILAPPAYEADARMSLLRDGAPTRSFAMHLWKQGPDKLRVRFTEPLDERGTEVLRDGDAMWQYLPNLKRALRISAKQEFHGGDFNNTDILRVDLEADYSVSLGDGAPPGTAVLELRGRDDRVTYDRVRFRVRVADGMPLVQEFYGRSGKLLRTLELCEPRAYGRLRRPSRLFMKNALVPSRQTELVFERFDLRQALDPSLFQQVALGR
jgi:outer membrane lipoprotein-sorting protein